LSRCVGVISLFVVAALYARLSVSSGSELLLQNPTQGLCVRSEVDGAIRLGAQGGGALVKKETVIPAPPAPLDQPGDGDLAAFRGIADVVGGSAVLEKVIAIRGIGDRYSFGVRQFNDFA
jgi:hypothetical protein